MTVKATPEQQADRERDYRKHDTMTDPHAICAKWVRRIGIGFHPDTRGKEYFKDKNAIKEYDTDMETLFSIAADPYECAIMAMADAGLC